MFQHTTTTHVGLDVSKASISVALLRPDGHLDEERIANTPEDVRRLVRRWPEPARVRACYEAGPTGYDLYRQLTALGVETTVIAPSLTPRRPGDRIKTDRRDARKLAGLFRAGELTAVRVPTPEEEAVRDLLRARQDERRTSSVPATGCRSSCCATAGSTPRARPGRCVTAPGSRGNASPSRRRSAPSSTTGSTWTCASPRSAARRRAARHRPSTTVRAPPSLASAPCAASPSCRPDHRGRGRGLPPLRERPGLHGLRRAGAQRALRRADDRARSPRPATPTSAASSWRPPGTPAAGRTWGRPCAKRLAGQPPEVLAVATRAQPPAPRPLLAAWWDDADPRPSRSSPWPASWPASAGPSDEQPRPRASAGRT